MTKGDLAQVIATAAALLVSVAVAVDLWRRDRRANREVERQAVVRDAVQAEGKRRDEEERERRAIRRQQHASDYELTKEALTQAERTFELILDEPRTALELDGFGIDDPRRTLDAIAKRVPALSEALRLVVNDVLALGRPHFPSIPGASLERDGLHTFTRLCVASGIRQTRAAETGIADVAAARQALHREWGT